MNEQRNAEADYERWKHAGSAIPFRYSFSGLLAIVVITLTTWDLWWNSPFRGLGLAGVCLLLVGACALFYDIPRRRLGTLSKSLLFAGFVAIGIMTILRVAS